MTCEWGHVDCLNEGKKCDLCFSDSFHYLAPAKKKPRGLNKRQQKADGRMGSSFEFKNHQNNNALLQETGSRMTPNSGAGKIKGDEQIRGLVNIMEELKTKVTTQAPGKQSFTIKREWLDKLNREAKAAGEEFWYLKFSFHEYDDDIYIVVEQDVVMSMVATLVEDRKGVNLEKAKTQVAENRARLLEAENVKLLAEIELLKSQLKLQELEENPDAL